MAQVNVAPLIAANEKRWHLARVNPLKMALITRVAQRLVAPDAKRRYQEISRETGVPWWIVAVIHERESGQRWDRSIAQGDPFNRASTHVPKGRGPFPSWRAAALDALRNCAPYAARWKNWTIGGALTLLEMYNGLGYYRKGRPSSYIWASTNQYTRGKYVADGRYDPSAVDQQLGCAAVIKRMGELDPDVRIGKDGKKVETGGGAAAGGTAAAEAARQTSENADASHADAAREMVAGGVPWTRVLIVVGVAVAVGLLGYALVRFVKRYRPVVVEVPDVTAQAGAERVDASPEPEDAK
jgi:lysozyme family protein